MGDHDRNGVRGPGAGAGDPVVDLGIAGVDHVVALGEGGSSTVYRGRQSELDRDVAIKVVHAGWNAAGRERFERERSVMGRLSGHAGIVPVLATGRTARGEPFLLLPYYRRGSLYTLIRERGALPWREAVHLVEPLVQAVADCHRAGLVHRDVKPANVLLTDQGRARLTDFGIALPIGAAIEDAAVAYTPAYSPPEALRAGAAAPSGDVYSLGATLWALVAGRPPTLRSASGAVAGEVDEGSGGEGSGHGDRHKQGGGRGRSVVIGPSGEVGAAVPLRGVPQPLADLLHRCLDADPGHRPPDAAAFAAELRRAVRLSEDDGDEGGGRDGRPSLGPGRLSGVDRLLVAVVVVGVVLVALGLVWS